MNVQSIAIFVNKVTSLIKTTLLIQKNFAEYIVLNAKVNKVTFAQWKLFTVFYFKTKAPTKYGLITQRTIVEKSNPLKYLNLQVKMQCADLITA